jgi:hypothetical protein
LLLERRLGLVSKHHDLLSWSPCGVAKPYPPALAEHITAAAELVMNEIESLDPPGRFLELNPGKRCFRIIERPQVVQAIKKKFISRKGERNKKSRQKSWERGCPVATHL